MANQTWCLLLTCAALASGCAANSRSSTVRRPLPPRPAEYVTALSAVYAPRGQIDVDVLAVGSLDAVDRRLDRALDPAAYLTVTAAECRCRAAAKASAADLLAFELQLARHVAACGPEEMHLLASVQSRLLALRAEDRRNRAAADALALFYQLADSQAQWEIAAQARAEAQSLLSAAERIEEITGDVVPQESALRQQAIEAHDRQSALAVQILGLNDRLRLALAVDEADSRQIWPQADLSPRIEPIDIEAAQLTAFERRPDLESLRLTLSTLGTDTLPLARAILAQTDPALGTVAATAQGSETSAATCELRIRRQQLAAALLAEEHRVALEVAGAALEAEAGLRHVARAKEILQIRDDELQRLEQKRQTDDATTFDLGSARLDALRAQGELIHQLSAWRISESRLSAATAALLDGCTRAASGAPADASSP